MKSNPNAESPTLLIVEDEPDLQELLDEEARALGYRTLLASNGKEALSLLTSPQEGPRIVAVLSDLTMPFMDGLELLARASKLRLSQPFLFLSGYADREKAATAKKMGALGLLEKPCDHGILLAAIRDAVEAGLSKKAAAA